jgi:hypothetical protein
MKNKIFLLLAITLVTLDILFLFSDHFLQWIDFLQPLLAINALFALSMAFVFFLENKRFQLLGKLPVTASTPLPTLQFSDQLLIRHFPDLLCLKDQDGRWLSASLSF